MLLKAKRYVLSLMILFVCASYALAQNFTLQGKVVDEQTNEPLPGATVIIESLNQGTTTNADGTFVLENITLTSIVATISYIGYETKQLEVDFRNKKSNNLSIRLASSSLELATIEVQGIATGQIKAFIEQKNAENIKHIVSAAQIITFPDLNAAEVMQRIPGVTLQRDQGEGRYVQLRGTPPALTNFNINGEQVPSPEGSFRYVGMDIIPSDQIANVEVTKVLTPDMDADGIGGSVKIVTKSASGEKPEITATMAAGYNHLRQAPNYNLQFAYGQRYKRLGFQINSSFFENNQGADNIEYKFGKGPFFNSTNQQQGTDNFFVQYRESQLRHYNIKRTRISVSPTLDYKFDEKNYVYLKAMYNSFSDDEIRRRIVYDLDDPLNETYYLFGGVEHDVRDRLKRQELSTISLGGEHEWRNLKLDYQFFYAIAREREPNRLEATFDSPGQAIAIDFDVSDPDYPRATFPNPTNAGNATDYENFELDQMLLETSDSKEVLLTPRINFTIDYDLGNGQDGYLKFGAKARIRDKTNDVRSQTFGAYNEQSTLYPGLGAPLNLASIRDDFYEDNLLNKGYELTFIPDAQQLRDFYEFYPQYFIFDRNESRKNSYNADYKFSENIYAAYAMLRHNIGKLMILGGVRFERTDITNNQGFGVIVSGSRFIGIDTISSERTKDFLLPQVQLRYAINPNLNIRGALTYTYSRPNYEDVIPSREQDREEVSIGNPELEYPSSLNVDFLIERYFKTSLLSGGLFYKRIEDFVFSFKRFGREGDPNSGTPLVEITKPINGNRSFVYGAELQAQFKFDFLSGFFSDFGVFTNYTYTYSEAFINQRFPANYADAVTIDLLNDDLGVFFANEGEEKITLPGQAQHTANVALFYDAKKLFTRLSVNYQDAFLYRLGADADLDEYYDKALRLDLTANYQITPNINIFTDWININNAPLRFYLGEPSRIKQQEFYSWWNRIGVRMKF